MINELDLKGNELLVYALIHGFCQDGKSVFKGSLNYIMAWLNISKPVLQLPVLSMGKSDSDECHTLLQFPEL